MSNFDFNWSQYDRHSQAKQNPSKGKIGMDASPCHTCHSKIGALIYREDGSTRNCAHSKTHLVYKPSAAEKAPKRISLTLQHAAALGLDKKSCSILSPFGFERWCYSEIVEVGNIRYALLTVKMTAKSHLCWIWRRSARSN